MSGAPTAGESTTRPRLSSDNGRKRSFGRVFDRIRTALRRREVYDDEHNSQRYAPSVEPTEEEEASQLPVEAATLLAVDEDDTGDAEGAVTSFGLLGRKAAGISEAKARQFFEQHGLTYHTREASVEPAAKLRRVERPARMRVRWTCHSCRSVFGAEKWCPGCGHRRCFECTRDPSLKIKVPELRQGTEAASLVIRAGAGTAARPISPNMVHAMDRAKPPPIQAWQCTIQIGRPRKDSYLVSHTSASTSAHHQHCHLCERRLDSTNECKDCQHNACALCPMLAEASAERAPAQVPLVERVYKKPRQRVRYNCENCDTQFTDRHECSGCGHERCEHCPRYPPRKQKYVHDTETWAAVQAKMAMVSTRPAMTVPETTLSIMDTPQPRL